jgi:hypothetical protein
MHCKRLCALYPRKQTGAMQLGMSALGQKRTHAVQQCMSAKGQKPTLVGYSITSSALPGSEVRPRSRQIVRCVPPPNATNRNASWQPSISASKSPESSGKTHRHLLLGVPIACSLRSSWPRENRQPYRLRSPGNFTELLGGIR